MRNLFKFYVALATFVLLGGSALAQTVTIDGVKYTVYGDSVHVTGHDGSVTEVNIPATVTINSVEYPVRVIGQGAFSSAENIISVVLPEGLLKIRDRAFRDCLYLKSIVIPGSIIEIGDGYNKRECEVFRGCVNLYEIVINEGFKGDLNHLCFSVFSINAVFSIKIPSSYSGVIPSSSIMIINRETPPSTSGTNSNNIVFVPDGCKEAYDTIWTSNTIIEGDGVSVDVNITTPGTFGLEVLKQVAYLKDVNYLKVSGTLNSDDFAHIYSNMPNLIGVDYSDLNIDDLSSDMLPSHKKLLSIVLPKSIERIKSGLFVSYPNLNSVVVSEGIVSIEQTAFSNCKKLRDISLPSTLKNIDDQSFKTCTNLDNVILPDGLTNIGKQAFDGCLSLKNMEFSEKLEEIGINAFINTGLETVVLPEGLRLLGVSAFSSCRNLTTLTLPSTLYTCGDYFVEGCAKLQSVKCLSVVPPSVSGSLIETSNTWTLYVPGLNISTYKLTAGWNNFYKIEPLEGFVSESICVYNEQMLDFSTENLLVSGTPVDYKPNIYIRSKDGTAGKLKTVGKVTSGQASMSIAKFEMDQTRSTSTMTSFINMLESDSEMTADSVVTNLEVSTGGWHFLSFPYDVKISDISTMGNWVIRRYVGAARANGDYSNTWVTVPYEETLNAGEGYIWTTTNGKFRIPAVDNENKNNLFANSTQYVPLREFASTTIADNSWNLVGNPFPCYYDTRFLEYTAPITVRNGNSYSAYSPVDDSYILMPLEAFFVQKPSNVESIGFTTDGRQTNNSVRTLDTAAKSRTANTTERKVFNINIEGAGHSDRTRFVINESASSAYEMECDAAKFMSDDTSVPQIFTVENADRLAINERPMGNGEIALGAYFGTAGTYTLSLDTKCNHTVILVDNITGEETVLTDGDYTFEAEQGMFNDRFTIRLWDDIVNGVDETVSGNNVTVSAASDGIVVMNATEDVYVYNTAGSLMDVKSGDSVFFSLPQGMYVVKVGNESYKISVTR